MDSILFTIHSSDPLWITIAFIFGLLLKSVGLPPLIGFLAAGFALHALGAKDNEFLQTISDMSITLLLFSIGLKLKVQSLAKPEVWGVASIHMMIITLVFGAIVFMLSVFGLPLFVDLSLETSFLIGFVLSFSSTVFAIKILEEKGAMSSKHGQVAIGILVMQDIAAVVFLAVSSGKVPSIWALALILLLFVRPVLFKILEKVGHGELLVLLGVVLALGGASIFESVGMKGDVGAIIFGMLMASHSKSTELAKSLLNFKELLLVGFFLSVGMAALPGSNELIVAVIFLALLPLKVAVYYGLFTSFYLRASTSWRTSLNLANYSEFGLIVGALAASYGWLPKEWLAVFAIALSVSFIISAPVVNVRDNLYKKWRLKLKFFERKKRLSEEKDMVFTDIKVAIFGMGRVGSSVYQAMESDYRGHIVGVEIDIDKQQEHHEVGRNVVRGDSTNPDFWTRATGLLDKLEWVILTLPSHAANIAATEQLKQMAYTGGISATSKFADEELELKEIGVSQTFNIYTEAGIGFANDLKKVMKLPAK